MPLPDTRAHPVLLFDGVCNLCESTVRFVIRRDRAARFRFASLQSPIGRALAAEAGVEPGDLESMILIEDGSAYRKSAAALRIARRLDGPWPAAWIFVLVPPVLRDAIYSFIGTRRYRWFGRKDECWLPEDRALAERFLDAPGAAQSDAVSSASRTA